MPDEVPIPTPPAPVPGPGPIPTDFPIPGADSRGPALTPAFNTTNKPNILSPYEQVIEKNKRDMDERALSMRAASLGMPEDRYRYYMHLIGSMGLAKDLPEAMRMFDAAMTTLQFDWGNQEDLDALETIIRYAGGFSGPAGFARTINLINEFMDGVRGLGGQLDKRAIISVILDVASGRISGHAAADKIFAMTHFSTMDFEDPWSNIASGTAGFQKRRDIRQKFEQAMNMMFTRPQDPQQQSAALLSRQLNAASFALDRMWMAIADAMGQPVANAADMIRKTYGSLAKFLAKNSEIRAIVEPFIQWMTQMGLFNIPVGKTGGWSPLAPPGYNPSTLIPENMPATASTSGKLVRLARKPENGRKLVRLAQMPGEDPNAAAGGTVGPQRAQFQPTQSPSERLDDRDISSRALDQAEAAFSQEGEQLRQDIMVREKVIAEEMATIQQKIEMFQQGVAGIDQGLPDTRIVGIINQSYTELANKFDELVKLYDYAVNLAQKLLQKAVQENQPAQVIAGLQWLTSTFVKKQQEAVNNRQKKDVDAVVAPYRMREKAIGVSMGLAEAMGEARAKMFNVVDYGQAVALAAARAKQMFDAADELERKQPGQVSSLRAQQLRAEGVKMLTHGFDLSGRAQQPTLSNAEAGEMLGGLPG